MKLSCWGFKHVMFSGMFMQTTQLMQIYLGTHRVTVEPHRMNIRAGLEENLTRLGGLVDTKPLRKMTRMQGPWTVEAD